MNENREITSSEMNLRILCLAEKVHKVYFEIHKTVSVNGATEATRQK